MSKATTVKEAIASFEKAKGVSSGEAEKVRTAAPWSEGRDVGADRRQTPPKCSSDRLNSWHKYRPLKSWMGHCQL